MHWISFSFVFFCAKRGLYFFVQKGAKYLITLQWILQSLILTLKTTLLVSYPVPFYVVLIFPLSMCACVWLFFFVLFFLFSIVVCIEVEFVDERYTNC